MKTRKEISHCCDSQPGPTGWWGAFRLRLAGRLNEHIANCPKCRRRLAGQNRVELALMLMKTQPQSLHLLAKANAKTLGVLKHSLREAPKSESLRRSRPDTGRFEKMRPGMERVANTAACFFVVLMIKTGLTNSLADYQNQGETAIHNYYARNLGQSMADELLPPDTPLT